MQAMSETASPIDFPKLLREQSAAIKGLLARMTSAAEADDLFQEVSLKAARALNSFRGDAEPATWLHQIARNTALDHLKSRRHRQTAQTDAMPEEEAYEALMQPAIGTKAIEADEMHGCIREYVAQLATPQRQILEMKDFQGLSNAEIAQQLGISVAAAKIRLHRARAALRESLETGCEFYQSDTGDLACDRRDQSNVSLARAISSKEMTSESGARCSDADGVSSNRDKTMSSSSNCCAPMSCAAPAPAAEARSLFTPIAAEFVALGAAIGANCELCLRHHTAEALKVGISIEDIARAVEMAEKVKATPSQLMHRLAERLIKNGGRDSEPAAPAGSCGCG